MDDDKLYQELLKVESKINELNEKLNILSRTNLNIEKYCFVMLPGDGISILELQTNDAMPITYKTKQILKIEDDNEFDKFFSENKCC